MSNRLSSSVVSPSMLNRAVSMLIALIAVAMAGCGSTQSFATAAVLSLSVTTLNLGTTALGASSAAQTVTITNTGNATLSISNIAISGDFTQTNSGCTPTVAVNGSCTISIIFTPTAVGARTGTLTLTSNSATSPQTVALTGTGTVAVISLSPTSLIFGNTSVGTPSTAQALTVTNTGSAPLTITNIAVTGDFSEVPLSCASPVAPNATCQIAVNFVPTATGTRTGTLTVTSNAQNGPQTVTLTGTGTPGSAVLLLSATSITFPNTAVGSSSVAQTLTLKNTGAIPVTISNIALTGDYSDVATGCSVALATNATCQIAITFTPTAAGIRAGTLTLTSNGTGSPQTVSLTGTGIAPVLSLSSTALNFGNIILGSSSAAQMVTITNTGTSSLTISNIATTGDYADVPTGCAVALAVNATCQVAVTFTPTASGTRTGSLTFTSNTVASPQTVALTGTGTTQVFAFQLTAQAGTNPIAGAAVQVYAAGNSGNGSSPTALLSSPLTTSSAGVATVPSSFTCPAGSPVLYAVSRGGTVTGASGANANAVLMTAIGPCGSISTGSNFVVDEATTVAAVEALAPFYAAGGAIGASATNTLGLTNAIATAATLADPVAGKSPGPTLPSNAVSPAPRVNSLANLLNSCVVSSSACSALYNATAQGSTLATNTLDAAFYLVKNPTVNVATLYSLSLASTAYTPVLTTIPTDWTMFINYSGGGMDSPSGLGIDSKGNVWVASYFNVASKFTPIGSPVFPAGITGSGLDNSYGLAIDLNDNVWIPNEQPFTSVGIGSVSELTSSGASLAGNGYLNGGLNYPLSVAIDPNGTVWVVDYGNSHLTLLNSSGTPLSGSSGYTTPLFAFPVAVAVDGNHFGWIVNQSSNNITKVAPDGSSFTNYNCCDLASGLAIDQGDNIWVANYFGNTVSLVTNGGTTLANSLNGNGSINHPQGIAVDGAGTVWVANYRAGYLTELAGANSGVPGASLSPATGIGGDANLLEAYALSLDASGNIWVSNQGNNTITKFIGLAVPVKTPLSGLPKLP